MFDVSVPSLPSGGRADGGRYTRPWMRYEMEERSSIRIAANTGGLTHARCASVGGRTLEGSSARWQQMSGLAPDLPPNLYPRSLRYTDNRDDVCLLHGVVVSQWLGDHHAFVSCLHHVEPCCVLGGSDKSRGTCSLPTLDLAFSQRHLTFASPIFSKLWILGIH